jgi:chemotaxis signal transduction protein
MAKIGKMDGAAAREMLTFVIGRQEFCIDVMSVREIRV